MRSPSPAQQAREGGWLRASNLGAPITICGRESAPSRAYFDAARRLAGEAVEMTIPTDKEGLFTKLWGRRAA